MRTLVKLLLDDKLSRRDFVKELTALGVGVTSAQALLNSIIPEAHAAKGEKTYAGREVTGNGSDLLIESLLEAGVTNIFHGNGGNLVSLFDSVVTRPQIKNFLATNEGQCLAMAEGFHLASGGELGVAVIPKHGLGNATGNFYNALAGRSSLLIISMSEDAEYSDRGGDAVDWEDAMSIFAKWSYRMRNSDRVPEFTRRAMNVAMAPPGGPTFLQLDTQLYDEQATAKILPRENFQVSSKIRPNPDDIMDVARLLLESESPLVTVGHEVSRAGAVENMTELAELLALPVTEGHSGLTDFPNRHPLFLGDYMPFLPQARNADLYLNLGSAMPDPSRVPLFGPIPNRAKAVHATHDSEIIGVPYPTDVNILADVGEVISDLTEAVKSLATKDRLRSIRDARFDTVREYSEGRRQRKMDAAMKNWDRAPMSLARIVTELDELLEEDAILVSEATPIYSWEWFDLGPGKKQFLRVPGNAILGWATGAALGAKLAQPDKQVVALSGDGAFMFQHDLWAMARYDAPVIVVVFNNHSYNTTRAFNWTGPAAKAGKDMINYLGNPDVDFSLIAKGYGVDGEVVQDASELRPAIMRAIQATKDGRPYLLDVNYERSGMGGELTSHPDISIAAMRTREI
jgi:acetolactate synthase-1/2/3 large subunit